MNNWFLKVFRDALCMLGAAGMLGVCGAEAASGSESRLSDEAIPLQLADFPDRPALILEWGEPFLKTGELSKGFNVPTGAVWRPALWVFGNFRSGVQSFDSGPSTRAEWSNRIDLFGNLRLTGTERVVVGFRPVDGVGAGSYFFRPRGAEGWQDGLNGSLEHLFFEGDIGELFPALDFEDFGAYDLGFSVGRQDLTFQEGLLINDNVDVVGLTRNTVRPGGVINFRMTGLYGWNNIHRGNNVEDNDAHLLGFLTEWDVPKRTVSLDFMYVLSDSTAGDGFYAGLSSVQRMGHFNTAFRANASFATGDETAAVGNGVLLLSEVSWTPHHTHDLIYVNGFLGINRFTSAARGPANGGPLGRAGILFAGVGLGRFGAALSSAAQDVVGGSIGYQRFFDHGRKQAIFEVAGRKDTNSIGAGAVAGGLRYQQAIGRRMILRLDGFGAAQQNRDAALGGRFEVRVKF